MSAGVVRSGGSYAWRARVVGISQAARCPQSTWFETSTLFDVTSVQRAFELVTIFWRRLPSPALSLRV